MRYDAPRLIDPTKGHERLARQEFGVKGLRELDDDARIATEQSGDVPANARPRVTGSLRDGSAVRELVLAGERAGLWDDETDADPDLGPSPYEYNRGLLFRGAAPTRANGGTTVIGTGGDVTLNDATDNSGRITLVTGTGVSAVGTICTIAFAVPKANADYAVLISAADADSASAAGRSVYANFGDRSTTSWVLACQTALASSTSYHWDFLVIERESL